MAPHKASENYYFGIPKRQTVLTLCPWRCQEITDFSSQFGPHQTSYDPPEFIGPSKRSVRSARARLVVRQRYHKSLYCNNAAMAWPTVLKFSTSSGTITATCSQSLVGCIRTSTRTHPFAASRERLNRLGQFFLCC